MHDVELEESVLCVWLAKDVSQSALERPAAIDHHEIRLAQLGAVERGFKPHRVRSADVEISTGARGGVQMYGQTQASTLGGDVAKEKVLQLLVSRIRNRSTARAVIQMRGFRPAYIVELERPQIGSFELYVNRACARVT